MLPSGALQSKEEGGAGQAEGSCLARGTCARWNGHLSKGCETRGEGQSTDVSAWDGTGGTYWQGVMNRAMLALALL